VSRIDLNNSSGPRLNSRDTVRIPRPIVGKPLCLKSVRARRKRQKSRTTCALCSDKPSPRKSKKGQPTYEECVTAITSPPTEKVELPGGPPENKHITKRKGNYPKGLHRLEMLGIKKDGRGMEPRGKYNPNHGRKIHSEQMLLKRPR